MKIYSKILCWFFVIALILNVTNIHAATWKKLGTRTVKHSTDRDVIHVGAKKGTFTAIKLTVKKASVHFIDMKVYFENGDVKDVQIRKLIPRGGETRVIDLPGQNRKIKKVVFWYKTRLKNQKKAKVRLWGRR
jgi:hypothetical protein